MPIRFDCPLRGGVTGAAVTAELPRVAVLVLVTAGAVEQSFVLLWRVAGRVMNLHVREQQARFACVRRLCELAQPDASESRVVHGGAQGPSRVLLMTRAAMADVGMKDGGLPLQ